MKDIIVSVDWGGTSIKLGLFDAGTAELIFSGRFAAESFRRPEKFFLALGRLLHKVAERSGVALKKVKGVAVGAPGIINMQNASIYYLPNIPGWENFPFRAVFEKKVAFPLLAFDNDANFAAWGEYKEGALRRSGNAVLITLGTGIGCGLIINRRLFHGRTSAAEGGHMAISLQKRKCSCSAYGCVESFLGQEFFLKSISGRFRSRYNVRDLKDLFMLAKKGNSEALLCWSRYGKILGVFLSGLINLLNPDRIALGGGVSGAFSFFRPALEKELEKRAMKPQLNQAELCRAYLGNKAGIYGGFWLAKEKLRR